MSKYVLYKVGHKRFLALDSNYLEGSLKLFPATTWKKKLVKSYVYIASKLRLGLKAIEFCDDFQLNSKITIRELLFELGGCLAQNCPVLVMWNRGGNRQGRVYIWRFSHDCKLESFIKLVDGELHRNALRQEMEALEFLSRAPRGFHHPRVIQYKEQEGFTLLETTAVPLDKSNSHTLDCSMLDGVIKYVSAVSYKKESFPWKGICNVRWGERLQQLVSTETMVRLNTRLGSASFTVGFIHGDFGSENIYDCDGEVWIVDWEASTSQGPVLVDHIGFWLGSNEKSCSSKIVGDFTSQFMKGDCYRREDVIAAILFLTSYEFPPAVKIFSYWEAQKFSKLL